MITHEAQTRWDGHRYLGALRHWLWLLALCALLGAAGTFLVTKLLQAPIYRASAVLVVDQQNAPDPAASAQIATTYASLVNQPIVLQTAAAQVGHISAAELAQRIQAYAQSNTALIVISADDPNPARAAVLANAVGAGAITALSQLSLAVKYPVVFFQPATPPQAPDHPKPLENSLVGGVLGLALAAVLIYLLDVLDGRKRTAASGAQWAELTGTDHMTGAIEEPEDLAATLPLPKPSVMSLPEDIKEQESPAVAQPLLEPSPVVPLSHDIEEEESAALEAGLHLPKLSVASMAEATKEQEGSAVTDPSPELPPIVLMPEDIKESTAITESSSEPSTVVPLLEGVKEQESPAVAKLLPRLPRVVQPPISLRKLGVLFIILAMLGGLGIGATFLSQAQRHPATRSTISEPTATYPAPPPTSTAVSVNYLRLARGYDGTIYDIPANISTSMSLTDIQQSQGNFTGRLIVGPEMRGSGLFSGTIDTKKLLQFTVLDAAGNATFFFEGAVHSVTTLSGDYYSCRPAQGSHCYRAPGSYGIWSLA